MTMVFLYFNKKNDENTETLTLSTPGEPANHEHFCGKGKSEDCRNCSLEFLPATFCESGDFSNW
jgi:hypothetical protein